MSDTIITVDKLCKSYLLKHQLKGGPQQIAKYERFSEVLLNSLKAPFRRGKATGGVRPDREEFWALRDVSFEIKRGDVLGIIGRNGAGKSTLLKILSRISDPTSGRIVIDGRVASLLEVGTGFHPELTGRENIFLNGAVLGMTRVEIKRKFDEIVAFADVERFLDTPVKRYSSGMYVRLAFAVAAHLEPEILVVDEVLAVGDAQFQKKCLGKMSQVSKTEGRTVLFVSHNMAAVTTLCSRAIMLERGTVAAEGTADIVFQKYLESQADTEGEVTWANPNVAPGNEKARLKAVRVRSEGRVTDEVPIDQECVIEMDYWILAPGLPISMSIHLLDKSGVTAFASVNFHSANLIRDDWYGTAFPVGTFRTTCVIPANFLNDGRYSVNVYVLTNHSNREAAAEDVISFNVYDTGAMRKEYTGRWIGVLRPKLAWQTVKLANDV